MYAGKILARILLGALQASLLLLGGALLFRMPLGDALVSAATRSLHGGFCRMSEHALRRPLPNGKAGAARRHVPRGGSGRSGRMLVAHRNRAPLLPALATLTPSYWCVHGLQRVMYFNKSHEVLLRECPILLAFAAAVLLVAIPLLERCRENPGGG